MTHKEMIRNLEKELERREALAQMIDEQRALEEEIDSEDDAYILKMEPLEDEILFRGKARRPRTVYLDSKEDKWNA